MTRFPMLLLALALLLSPRPAPAPPPPSPDEPLIGLWAFEADFGPALRGPLTIRRSRGGWRAAIGGLEAPASWHGRRIVTASWIAESTAPRIEISPATTGYSDEEFGNYYGRGRDGLAWHLGALNVGGREVRTYAAGGNGGQVLLVVPEYQLAVVFTGGNYGQGGVWGRWGQNIVAERIIPALRR